MAWQISLWLASSAGVAYYMTASKSSDMGLNIGMPFSGYLLMARSTYECGRLTMIVKSRVLMGKCLHAYLSKTTPIELWMVLAAVAGVLETLCHL